MLAYDFEYDGVRLSDIGYTICYFDDDDYRTVTNGSEITFNTVSTLHGAKYERASSEYDDCLTTTFQICKYQCDDDDFEISIHEFRHLMRWLNRKQFHKFKFINDEWIGFYWEGSFNLSRIEAGDKIIGVELELITNRPYGLMEPRVIRIDAAGESFAVFSDDDSSLTFYRDIPPKVGDTYHGKTVTSIYTGLKNTGSGLPEWNEAVSYADSWLMDNNSSVILSEDDVGIITQDTYDGVSSYVKRVEFDETFALCKPLSLHQWFYAFVNCTEFSGMEYLDTSQVTDMNNMFYECWSTTTIDVSGFDTSKVTNFSGMFRSCRKVKELDVTGFDTSNATTMSYMFDNCRAITELDVSLFDTSNVTTMTRMFYNCQALTTIHSNDRNFVTGSYSGSWLMDESSDVILSESDVGIVLEESHVGITSTNMFTDSTNLVGGKGTTYNSACVDALMAHTDTKADPGYFTYKDIGSPAISTLAASYPFAVYCDEDDSLTFYCDSLPAVGSTYNGKVVTAVFDSFVDKSYNSGSIPWFDYRNVCKSIVFDDTFCAERPTDCGYWFSNFTAVTSIDLYGLNTSNVVDFSYMFYACGSLETIDISRMDTTLAEKMSAMFMTCRSLTTIYSDDSVFYVNPNVVSGSNMFTSCESLVGGNGTEYSSNNVSVAMAHVDSDRSPGYFTESTKRRIFDGVEYLIQDFSDEEGFIYPLLEITIMEDGTLTIYNDIENRATTIRNCTAGEVITMDSPIITSSYKEHRLQNDFNWNFLRIANKMNERDNKLTITLPCRIKLVYSPIAKVGL